MQSQFTNPVNSPFHGNPWFGNNRNNVNHTGSISSDINMLNYPNQMQHDFRLQTLPNQMNDGKNDGNRRGRNLSTSVFNLHQTPNANMGYPIEHPFDWGPVQQVF